MNEQPLPADNASTPAQAADETAPNSLPVDMGRALPPADSARLPLLSPARQAVGDGSANASSAIAQGMHFSGQAQLAGPCSIAGEWEGRLNQAPGSEVSVVVASTGIVRGDITAQRISVHGWTDGLLDAGTGEVTLHDGAQVQGRVRYGRIQVNGADLNATLERVLPKV